MDYVLLIAAYNRFDLLIDRSLTSAVHQTVLPKEVIIVNDGQPFTTDQFNSIAALLAPIPFQIIHTSGNTGAAAAWNLGLDAIYQRKQDCYIAILDDDDTWNRNHGQLCLSTALTHNADIVISGLRLFDVIKNQIKERPLIKSIDKRQFLTGNPGWQGSNTFVKISMLRRVGGFTNGLQSCNDRDLAYRLLGLDNIQVAFTNEFTATWYLCASGNNLSSINNPAKREGLITFYNMYNMEMTLAEKEQFLARANHLFKIERSVFL